MAGIARAAISLCDSLRKCFCCRCKLDSGDSDNESSTRYSRQNEGFQDDFGFGAEEERYVPNPVNVRQKSSGDSRDMYIALYDYQARLDGDLSFKTGERFIVIDRTTNDPGWWILKSMTTSDEGYGPNNYIAPMGSAEQEEWYAGKITRAESRHRLVQPENIKGTYLVRESGTRPGCFSLDVLDVDGSIRTVKRYLIEKRADGRLYVNNTFHFANLIDIVNCYSKKEIESCKLVRACPAAEAPQPLSIAKDVFELERSSLSLDEEIGAGAFAEVWKGTWKGTTEVAIKILKEGTMTPTAFLREAEIMKNLRHPNIVTLQGVVSEEPIYIVTEYMQHGSLLQYLKKGPGKHTKLSEHLEMAAEVAAGMAYLESMNYVHRDLRADNVLVGKRGLCKVADYGLARLIKDEVYIAAKGSMFPVKWTAPEALTHCEFSSKSDVWSFGILLTEIVTRGAVPYYYLTTREVSEQVPAGYRMPQPQSCPDNIYEIMKRCWNEDPDQRPSFSHLKEEFESFTDLYERRWVPEEVQ